MRSRARSAFTLIELVVVVIVLGILLSILVPSFFGATDSAKDVLAKHYLAVAYYEARVASEMRNSGVRFATDGTPTGAAALAASIAVSEPELTITDGPDANAAAGMPASTVVIDDRSTTTEFAAYDQSGSGTVWCVYAATGPRSPTSTPPTRMRARWRT